mmetsp:Transcript_11645/g.33915  ORF Transcript_11645/g.33915 Transcript_11645/m.33915 type:complete len:118 (+) Transcript_11645:37-390(+)
MVCVLLLTALVLLFHSIESFRLPSPLVCSLQPGGSRGVKMVQETLYDMPISNHGARCRMIVYKKGIEDRVTIRPPGDLGGLKSEEYLKINPQVGSFCCVCPSGQDANLRDRRRSPYT